MNEYIILANLIISNILRTLNIQKDDDEKYNYSFSYSSLISNGTIHRKVPITSSMFLIFKLIGIDIKNIGNVSSSESLYNELRKSPFYGEDFMNLSRIITNGVVNTTTSSKFLNYCLAKENYYKLNKKVDNELFYVKMIDYHCRSKVEEELRSSASIMFRLGQLDKKLNINDVRETISPNDEFSVTDMIKTRSQFLREMSLYYPGFNNPIEQYLNDSKRIDVLIDFDKYCINKNLIKEKGA